MLVDARLVIGEILKDSEGCLDWSVVHQLQLDLVHVPLDRVALLSIALVLLIWNLELSILTGPVTFWSATSLLARASGPVDMVLTGLNLVGLATLVGPILAPTDKTLAAPETPGCSREATIASKSAGVAAGEEILTGHVHMLFSL